MIGVRDDDKQYRRGVVLGLTMAEIMLLLIFLLLLILAARLVDERRAAAVATEARKQAVLAKEEAEKKLRELEEIVGIASRKHPSLLDLTKEYQKVKSERDTLKKQMTEAKSAMEVLEEVRKDNQDMSAEDAAKELRRLADIGRATQKLAEELKPGAKPEEALDQLRNAASIGEAAIKSGKSPEDLLAGASCSKDLEICKASNIKLTGDLANKGGTLPSCWVDPLTGDTQYLFTAYLKNEGIYLEEINVPGRDRDRAKLPLAPLAAGKLYSAAEFVADGQSIFRWSDKQEPSCRFYVRAIDQTSNDDKDRYVRLKEKGVERVFYVKKSN